MKSNITVEQVREAWAKSKVWYTLQNLDFDMPEYFLLDETADGYFLDAHSMYNAPSFNIEVVRNLVELFQTDLIDEEEFIQSGCETCDYGSKYGVKFTIRYKDMV